VAAVQVIAIFGPTAAGKTGVAIALAELLQARGEDPVAVNSDSIQVYRGLEVLSGAATGEQQVRLEHRMLSFVPVSEEFSAGRYAELAHAEIDSLLAEGRRPIVVGGTGLYLRAALSDLDLRPPVPPEIREQVEREIAERGAQALHGELDPAIAATVDPADRKRIARWIELMRAGVELPESSAPIWDAACRHPTLLIGLTMERSELDRRIEARVEQFAAAGAGEEARAATDAGASRTARAALGFEGFLAGDLDAVKAAHRRFARRQLTWMRKMEGVRLIDRTHRDDEEVAGEIVSALR
jgi:tRNA dimethylallyltransferase